MKDLSTSLKMTLAELLLVVVTIIIETYEKRDYSWKSVEIVWASGNCRPVYISDGERILSVQSTMIVIDVF